MLENKHITAQPVSETEYERKLHGAVSSTDGIRLSILASKYPRPPSVPKFKTFLTNRPHLFCVHDDIVSVAEGSTADYTVVDTPEKLDATVERCAVFKSHDLQTQGDEDEISIKQTLSSSMVTAIDCEGSQQHQPALIQVATHDATYVFDCVKLGANVVLDALQPFLNDPRRIKLMHDAHWDGYVLWSAGDVELRGLLDTQLVHEYLNPGDLHIGFNKVLETWGAETHKLKDSMHQSMDNDPNMWSHRPLTPKQLLYAAQDATLLLKATSCISGFADLTETALRKLIMASELRSRWARNEEESSGNARYVLPVPRGGLMSAELAYATPEVKTVPIHPPQMVSSEARQLLDLLPASMREALEAKSVWRDNQVMDVVLDYGRPPLLHCQGSVQEPIFQDHKTVLDEDQLDYVVNAIGVHTFGPDNRATLDGSLHRISAIRDNMGNIIGLTCRIGRNIQGCTALVHDILADVSKSVLVLGPPGTGKTTLVRSITKLLADTQRVVIVDTSNEIAGDGKVPHSSVGKARRLMVPTLDQQCQVMIEGVQNHSPEVMVIDEIGRSSECIAARTVKERGVRLVASAHGTFESLLKNQNIRELVGGVLQSFAKGGVPRFHSESAPVFDVILELTHGDRNALRVIPDVARAASAHWRNKSVLWQHRSLLELQVDQDTKVHVLRYQLKRSG